MSSLMIFALVFVSDVWSGHVMFNLLLPAKVPRVYLALNNNQPRRTTRSLFSVYFLLLILVGLPCALSAYRVYKAMTLNEEESEGVNNDEEPSFRSWTAYVITKPKAWYCHLRLGVTFVLFFLWPGISLFTSNLPKAGVIFLFTSIFSLFRLNLDAGNILKEHSCRLMDVELCKYKKSSQQQMIARARASQVLSKITNSFLYFIAIIGFGFMGGYFVYFSGTSAGSGEDYNTQEQREPIRLLESSSKQQYALSNL